MLSEIHELNQWEFKTEKNMIEKTCLKGLLERVYKFVRLIISPLHSIVGKKCKPFSLFGENLYVQDYLL